MMEAWTSRSDDDRLSDLRELIHVVAGILMELSLDCWLASSWEPEEVEELCRRLIRASQWLQVSVLEARDALALSSAKLERSRATPTWGRRYNAH